MRTLALSEEVREMARTDARSNGDGEPGRFSRHMTEAVIPGGSLFLDLMPLTRVGKIRR